MIQTYIFNRITFKGLFNKFFKANISNINKREFFILLTLIAFTVILDIYPTPIINGLYYLVSSLIYNNYT